MTDKKATEIKGLYPKIHAIMCESEAIKKDMTVGNESYNNSYKAVSEAAVLNEIKPLLKKYGVILLPIEVTSSESFLEFQNKKKETVQRFITDLKAKYKIIDIETGEFEILQTVGYGADSQDKASGKAMTYAYKALIQKTFCLFSGEDSDNEHSDDITRRNTSPNTDTAEEQKQVEAIRAKKISVIKVNIIKNKIAEADTKIENVLSAYNLTAVEEFTEAQFEPLMKRLNATIEKNNEPTV